MTDGRSATQASRTDRPSVFSQYEAELEALEAQGLLRLPQARPRGIELFCSNDYLGFAGQPPVLETVLDRGSLNEAAYGAAASPLVTGYTDVHARTADALARWLGAESATLFGTGYGANLGALQALSVEGAVFLSDALNHASIIDGIRLGRSKCVVYGHLDLNDLEPKLRAARASTRGPVWVVTEAYFSMDGDVAPMTELRALCDANDAGLYCDEAHSLGVFGDRGRGISASVGVKPDILVGAFGKAFGLQGAAVVGDAVVARWLWNRARSFVFSTAPSPNWAAQVHARLLEVDAAADRRALLEARVTESRRALVRVSERLGGSVTGVGPISPWIVGPVVDALRVAEELAQRGYLVKAMRPPTVPRGTARLRMTTTLDHSADVHANFLKALSELT